MGEAEVLFGEAEALLGEAEVLLGEAEVLLVEWGALSGGAKGFSLLYVYFSKESTTLIYISIDYVTRKRPCMYKETINIL